MEENAREREERVGAVWLGRNCGRAGAGISLECASGRFGGMAYCKIAQRRIGCCDAKQGLRGSVVPT